MDMHVVEPRHHPGQAEAGVRRTGPELLVAASGDDRGTVLVDDDVDHSALAGSDEAVDDRGVHPTRSSGLHLGPAVGIRTTCG